jgi:hypothetical protein
MALLAQSAGRMKVGAGTRAATPWMDSRHSFYRMQGSLSPLNHRIPALAVIPAEAGIHWLSPLAVILAKAGIREGRGRGNRPQPTE